MERFLFPLRVLLDPLGAIGSEVARRRWLAPLVLVSLLTALSGAMVGLKLDTARLVIPQLQQKGELAKATEKDVSDAVEQARRVGLVAGVAKGLLLVPVLVLLTALALKVAAWLIGRSVAFVEAMTVAGLAALPIGLLRLIETIAVARLEVLTPAVAQTLVPTSLASFVDASPKMARVLTAVDAINLWVAVLLGLGFAAASKWTAPRGALFGLLLYALFAATFVVALPGLLPAGGPR